jgi:hypothetical protein
MLITKDVILDLLPLYEAGEVSADTRALVEAYLKEHPEVAAEGGAPDAMFKASPVTRPERDRRQVLEHTRRLLRLKHWLFGVALSCTLTAFSVVLAAFSSSLGTWFTWRDAPGAKLAVLSAGIICWIGYLSVRRQLRVRGM